MAFGIVPARVYANDGDENLAVWTVFPDHAHGKIVAALQSDTAVQVAIQAKLNAPDDDQARGNVVDLLNRATVNCIGQHIVGQALKPEKAEFTLYNLLPTGVAAEVDSVLSDAQNNALHTAFADGDSKEIIVTLSRQTGRAIFQASLSELTDLVLNPENILGKLKGALLQAGQGILPALS